MGKRKTIVCLETGKQFNSVENAANAIGVSSGFISRQIKAGKPIKGFYYYYAGEMLPDEYRQKIRNQKKKPNYKSRPVICLETGERFESISLVSRMLGISKSNVFHAMKNGSAVHGIHFYYGDELKPDDSFFKPKRRRKVRCTETGVVYESIKDAAERGCNHHGHHEPVHVVHGKALQVGGCRRPHRIRVDGQGARVACRRARDACRAAMARTMARSRVDTCLGV